MSIDEVWDSEEYDLDDTVKSSIDALKEIGDSVYYIGKLLAIVVVFGIVKKFIDSPVVEVSGNCCRCGWEANMCKCWQHYYMIEERE